VLSHPKWSDDLPYGSTAGDALVALPGPGGDPRCRGRVRPARGCLVACGNPR
jgi:hypothetical protein